MLVEATAAFLGLSVALYAVLAGADFGAGILTALPGSRRWSERTDVIHEAVAPVWEANHVWLILAVVIVFNGFPAAFAAVFTAFHIPLTLMLLGGILRGCAFTFAHYDSVHDHWHLIYRRVFSAASVATPLCLGVIAGGLMLGRATDRPLPGAGFAELYVWPWCNSFALAVGVFTAILFAFVAAVYLVGEVSDEALRAHFVAQARALHVTAVAWGLVVFFTAHLNGLPLIQLFLSKPISGVAMGAATAATLPLWLGLAARRAVVVRVAAAFLVISVLVGWFALQYPVIMATADGGVSLYDTAAPPATLRALVWALVVGVAIIVPALAVLYLIFKRPSSVAESPEDTP